MDTVQKLEEDGGEAAALAAGGQIAALAEFVAEGQPLFLHEHLKAFQRPVERITEKLGERNHLEKEEHNEYMPCVNVDIYWLELHYLDDIKDQVLQ